MTLWALLLVSLVGWVALLVSRHTFGGLSHILLVAAIVIGLVQILWRRQDVARRHR